MKSSWKAQPKKVIALYVKDIDARVVTMLEYGGTREILSELATTMWQD